MASTKDKVFTAYGIVANAIPNFLKREYKKKSEGNPIGQARDLALTQAEKYGVSEERLGKGDAVRHLVWQALTSRGYGDTLANLAGQYHELPLPLGAAVNQTDAEKEMDLYNNSLGREIGSKAKSLEDIYKLAQEYVDSGKAKYYSQGQMEDMSRLEEIKQMQEDFNNSQNGTKVY
jgi:hypothetical protein